MKDLIPPEGSVYAESAEQEPAVPEATENAEATQEPQLTDQQAEMLMQSLGNEQNLVMGGVSGLIAALAGAGVWAAVTVATEYQIGWMAVGIGFLVGYAVRLAGKGITPVFGALSALLSLAGCAVGNLLTVAWFIASSESMPLTNVVAQLNPAIAFDILASTFEAMDVLFYGLAAYFGYKTAFRQVTQADVDRALGKSF